MEYILNIVPVISKKAYEDSGDGMTTKPVTTAAYQVKEMVAGSTLTLEKNENYWQTDDSKRASVSTANVNTIVYKVVTEPSQMATAIQTGDIDVAQYMDTTAIDPFYSNDKATAGYQVEKLNSNMMFFIIAKYVR
ncbi:MAG: ABC transporter substrate-binding protein [Eubacterium ventriosum]